MKKNENSNSVLLAFLAYFVWGICPFFWKLLNGVSAVEIILHRILWSFILAGILIFFVKERRQLFLQNLKSMWKDKKSLLVAIIAGFLISLNWGIFVWAIINNKIIDTSIGYYINPMVSILLGFIFLKEKLKTLQKLAVAISGFGVLVLVLYAGRLPWVSLTLAFSFGLYGLIKKQISLPPIQSLFFECAVMLPIVISILVFLQFNGSSHFGFNKTGLFLVLAGPVTFIPLYLFSTGIKKIKLSTMGFIQYLSPTMTFLIGVFVYHEPLNNSYLIALILIWIGIILYLKYNYRN